MEPASRGAAVSQALVRRWVEALNAGDVEGMLALMDEDVRLDPLRLNGFDRRYRGHDGVRGWLARLEGLGIELAVSDVRGDGAEAIAVGELRLGPDAEPVPCWMLERIEAGRIVSVRQYLTDPDAFPKPNGGRAHRRDGSDSGPAEPQ